MATDDKKSWTNIGAVLAAIGASACCVIPLLLLSLGISGAWISTLTSFEAIRPIFIIVTFVFIGLSYRKLYLMPNNCKKDEVCPLPSSQRTQKLTFWGVSTLILFLLKIKQLLLHSILKKTNSNILIKATTNAGYPATMQATKK